MQNPEFSSKMLIRNPEFSSEIVNRNPESTPSSSFYLNEKSKVSLVGCCIIHDPLHCAPPFAGHDIQDSRAAFNGYRLLWPMR